MSDIENAQADWQTHHIEGFATAALEAGKDAYFKAPLISEIVPDLWMGGCLNGVRLPDDFDLVISLYPWERYKLGPETVRYEYKSYDAEEVPDLSEAVGKAIVEWDFGRKVLIHCQAGLNRSGLVAAQVLHAISTDGKTIEDCIQLLRDKRSPLVLCNQAFETWLRREYV